MITSFHIRGFRGYDDTLLSLTDHTCIVGSNGSGKTHILEGIHLASHGTIGYIQAPRYEDSACEIQYTDAIGPKTYTRERREKKDIYKIQGSIHSGIKYKQSLPYRSVFVSPFDMNLFYFAPSMRRDFIDSILDRSFGQFQKVRKDYELVMRQRNALLKKIREGEANKNDLPYWNETFADLAEKYHLYRMKWKNFIDENIHYIESYLPKYRFSHEYTSKISEKCQLYNMGIKESILHYLDENIERDILTGHTHIGPHIDDFHFAITPLENPTDEKIESALFLSRGENKVLLLALKQLEVIFLRKYVELPIVLLFDDIFAELDIHHAETLIRSFEAEQVIMTSQRALPEGEKWSHFSCINLNTEYHAKNSGILSK